MKRSKMKAVKLSHSALKQGVTKRTIRRVSLEQRAKWIYTHNIYRERVNIKNPSLIIGGKLVSDWKQRLHAAGIISMDWDMVADTLRDFEKQANTATYKRLASYKKPVTLSNVLNIVLTNYVANLLVNMDLNIAAVADKIGVTEDKLTDLNNWDRATSNGHILNKPGTIFTNPNNGKKWEFVWNYAEGADFHELN